MDQMLSPVEVILRDKEAEEYFSLRYNLEKIRAHQERILVALRILAREIEHLSQPDPTK